MYKNVDMLPALPCPLGIGGKYQPSLPDGSIFYVLDTFYKSLEHLLVPTGIMRLNEVYQAASTSALRFDGIPCPYCKRCYV